MERRKFIRFDTTAEALEFTGLYGEITMDMEAGCVCLHDGATKGGVRLAREDLNNLSASILTNKLNDIKLSQILLPKFDKTYFVSAETYVSTNEGTSPLLPLGSIAQALFQINSRTGYTIEVIDGGTYAINPTEALPTGLTINAPSATLTVGVANPELGCITFSDGVSIRCKQLTALTAANKILDMSNLSSEGLAYFQAERVVGQTGSILVHATNAGTGSIVVKSLAEGVELINSKPLLSKFIYNYGGSVSSRNITSLASFTGAGSYIITIATGVDAGQPNGTSDSSVTYSLTVSTDGAKVKQVITSASRDSNKVYTRRSDGTTWTDWVSQHGAMRASLTGGEKVTQGVPLEYDCEVRFFTIISRNPNCWINHNGVGVWSVNWDTAGHGAVSRIARKGDYFNWNAMSSVQAFKFED